MRLVALWLAIWPFDWGCTTPCPEPIVVRVEQWAVEQGRHAERYWCNYDYDTGRGICSALTDQGWQRLRCSCSCEAVP